MSDPEQSARLSSGENTLRLDAAARWKLATRLRRPTTGRYDAVTLLRYFALVTYAVPAERLAPHIPSDLFEIETFDIGGEQLALLSIVPFVDTDFHYPRLLPWPKWRFAQTNHRVYIRRCDNGEPAVWFLGTTLGSPLAQVPRTLWKMPWYRARYEVDCEYDAEARRHTKWRMNARAAWGDFDLELRDTGERARPPHGFDSYEDYFLRLTNPIEGFFRRTDGKVGRYSIWHPLMRPLTRGEVVSASFPGHVAAGILTEDELLRPWQVAMTPSILFQVHLPPRPFG